jgi:hypothetical protein
MTLAFVINEKSGYWILHSDAEYFPFAMRIAQATQLCGAAKILVLWLTRHHEKGNHHAEC